jgi:hypothetical protein
MADVYQIPTPGQYDDNGSIVGGGGGISTGTGGGYDGGMVGGNQSGITSQIPVTPTDYVGPQQNQQGNNQQVQGDLSGLTSLGKEAGKWFTQTEQANRNLSTNDYNAQMLQWKQDGKYWMDPESDVQPALDKYMNLMPSATAALRKSDTITGMNYQGDAGNQVEGAILNPAGYIENFLGDDWKGSGEYIWNDAVNRAVQIGGATGNSVYGYLGGAVIGILEGVFNWQGALDQDKETKKQQLAKYQEALRQWQEARRKRINSASAEDAINAYKNQKKDKAEAMIKTAAATLKKRDMFLDMIYGASGMQPGEKMPEKPVYQVATR